MHSPLKRAYDSTIQTRKVFYMNASQPKTFKQWHRIKRLHAAAFTGSERKSLSIHRIRQEEGKADIWYFEENSTFIGYAIATPGRDKVLINYLAVTPSMRGKNLGSIILKKLQQQSQRLPVLAKWFPMFFLQIKQV